MISNLEKFKTDLKTLIQKGGNLLNAIQYESIPEQFEEAFIKNKMTKKEIADFKKSIPSFAGEYQSWYSEALNVIKQLLPDRLEDFIKLYEKPKNRKEIKYGNYVIEDYLQNLTVTRGWEKEVVVGTKAAIPQFTQQLNILKSVKNKFESSLFDIKQLVQADLFDSELEVAKELLKNKFERAAGAVSGVVLEKHLNQVCENHKVILAKKDPNISDLNDFLKAQNIIDVPQWRFIQHLGDLRNLCDHDKKKEPSKEQVSDLIIGVEKITKTLF